MPFVGYYRGEVYQAQVVLSIGEYRRHLLLSV